MNTSKLIVFSIFLSFIFYCNAQENCIAEKKHLPNELYGMFNYPNDKAESILNVNAYISCIYQDQEDNIWFGTIGRGVIRYDGENYEYLKMKDGLIDDTVKSISQDQEGNFWFGTPAGISFYNGRYFKNYSSKDGMIYSNVKALAFDNKGILWIGSKGGLMQFNDWNFKSVSIAEAKSQEAIHEEVFEVNAIHIDKEDKISIASNLGAYFYDESWSRVGKEHGLASSQVNEILKDSKGKLWFATNAGLSVWDGTNYQTLATKPGFTGESIASSVYEDKNNIIWFPIEGVGMYRFDGSTLDEVFKEQSCISHTLRYSLQDPDGKIWFGGWLGIYRYDG